MTASALWRRGALVMDAAGPPAPSISAPVLPGTVPVCLQLAAPPAGEGLLPGMAAAFGAASPWPHLAEPSTTDGAA